MKFKLLAAFAAGLTIGSLTTLAIFKSKYSFVEEEYEEEIESIEDTDESETTDEIKEDDGAVHAVFRKTEVKEDLTNYNKITSNYTDEPIPGPEFIPSDEFGMNEDYSQIFVTYFEGDDTYVYDQSNEPMDDLANTIGIDACEFFGEWDDNIIHIVNHDLECYYEITKDNRSFYSDIIE